MVKVIYACWNCKVVNADPNHVQNNWCPYCKKWGLNAPADPLWETKEGHILRLSEMTTSHLQYSIAKILREDNWRKHWMDKLLAELKRRKDIERAAAEERFA